MKIDFSNKVVVPEHVMFKELEGEAVLLNLDNEEYYGLDDVGTRIWEVISTSESISKAFDILSIEYDVEPRVLEKDIKKLIGDLCEEGLVEVVTV